MDGKVEVYSNKSGNVFVDTPNGAQEIGSDSRS